MRVRALVAVFAGAVCTMSAATAVAGTPQPSAAAGPTTTLIVHTTRTAAQLTTALAHADSTATVRRQLVRGTTVAVRVRSSDLTAQRIQLAAVPGVTSVETPVTRRLFDLTPDDPYYPRQAGYLAAVRAPAAWARQRGSAAVTIAVVDSGIDVTHPDLAGKVVATYNAMTPGRPIADTLGHGTFVAGVAAADTDNGAGVAGAGFATSLLGVKVAGSTDEIAIDDEVAGIRWAADHGADIVNLSLGGTDYSRAEAQAVAYAQAKGALVVAAAGNGADDTPQYPASYPGVVSVGAVDTATRTRADFTSYGPSVTLAAPGVDLVSTTPQSGSRFFPAGRYATASGTSFAAPVVSGEAALLLAQNPTLSAAELRAALVRSAHGYQRLGLGAGLVDFSSALDHVRPTTVPGSVVPFGDHGDITVRAGSTAPAVAFALDEGRYSAPVAVRSGTATVVLPTAGYGDGRHTVSAVDCTTYGECNPRGRTATVELSSAPPVITAPGAGATITGLATVTASRTGGGTLRLLVDGAPRGTDRSSPYAFALNASALRDGAHTLTAQLCSADGTRCDGPASAPVEITTAALHPGIRTPSPARISPNGDGVQDAAGVGFALPDTERVVAEVRTTSGAVVARYGLGTLRAGRHAWTWRGLDAAGHRLPDGAYTLAVSTSRGALRGWAATTGVVDTAAPALAVTPPRGATFYPYPDGYRDTSVIGLTLGSAAVVHLEVIDARGRAVARIAARHAAGRTTIAWNGTDAHRHRVAAGNYRYRLSVTDAAGNTRAARAGDVTVSAARLQRRTESVLATADRLAGSGGSSPCARVSPKSSAYRHGALYSNTCRSADYDIAFARYTFTVPKAVRWTALAVGVLGRAGTRRAQLTAAFERTDGVVEVPAYTTVDPGAARWHTVATVSGVDHVGPQRRVSVTLVLTSEFAGTNTFDAAFVRLRVGLVVLR